MTGPAPVVSFLGRMAARNPMNREELDALKRAAWFDLGIAVIVVREIADEWLRQGVTNEMSKQHGRRMKR